MSVSNQPSVSIIIPTYNEADNIEAVVKTFLATEYSNLQEILVVDGGSEDSTQEKVAKLVRQDNRVKLLPNPDKIQSAALNIGLHKSQGDIFLRADAHCHYATDYIDKCVQSLLSSNAINVGGAQRFIAKSSFQGGIALAAHSLLGNGGAKYRNPKYNGYGDTVFLGCMWRKSLVEIGGYANQITNEDAELNQRLLAISSEAIYISSEIKVWYLPRQNWQSLWWQYFKYGRGRFLTSIKHKSSKQLRGKLPFIVISLMFLWFAIDLLSWQINLYSYELCLLLLIVISLESLRVNFKYQEQFKTEIWQSKVQKPPSLFWRWLFCSIAIMTMPLAHFSGYSYQLVKNKILRISGW